MSSLSRTIPLILCYFLPMLTALGEFSWNEPIPPKFDIRKEIIETISIASEIPLGDGTTEVQITVELECIAAAAYRKITSYWDPQIVLGGVAVKEGGIVTLVFPDLGPGATVSAEAPISVIVPNAELDSFRDLLATQPPRDLFTLRATERPVYTDGTVLMDEATLAAYHPDFTQALVGDEPHVLWKFTSWTPQLQILQPGHVFWFEPLDEKESQEYDLGGVTVRPFTRPIEITSVAENEGMIEVLGTTKEVEEIIDSFTYRAEGSVTPGSGPGIGNVGGVLTALSSFAEGGTPLGTTFSGEFVSIPIRFNELSFGPKNEDGEKPLRLSGQLTIQLVNFSVEVRVRKGKIETFVITPSCSIASNIVLQTTAPVHLEEEKNLLQLLGFEEPIISVPIISGSAGPIPFDVTLEIEPLAGVSAQLPTGVMIPLRSAISGGVRVGWENGEWINEPLWEVNPLKTSPPLLFENTTARASAWAGAQVSVTAGVGGQGILAQGSVGMKALARADLSISPLSDPWWRLDAGVSCSAVASIELLTVELADGSWPVYEKSFFARDSGGPLIQHKSDNGANVLPEPISGADVRWARGLDHKFSPTHYEEFDTLTHPSGRIIFTAHSKGDSILGAVDADGTEAWLVDLRPTATFLNIDAMTLSADEQSILAVGTAALDVVLASFSLDGELEWYRRYEAGVLKYITDLHVHVEDGTPFIYSTGRAITAGSPRPWVTKFTEDGSVVWSNRYLIDGSDSDHAYCSVFRDDGRLILGGVCGGRVCRDHGSNGFFLDVDTDGNPGQAFVRASLYTTRFDDLLKGPDGTIYYSAKIGGTVVDDQPRIGYGILADSLFADPLVVGQDQETYQAQLGDDISGGDTAWDTPTDLVWNGEGPLIVAKTGLGNSPNQNGKWPGTTALLIQLAATDDKPAILWMASWDNPENLDLFSACTTTETGVFVIGQNSGNFPTGPSLHDHIWYAHIPAGGGLEFHERNGAELRYIQPFVSGTQNPKEFDPAVYFRDPHCEITAAYHGVSKEVYPLVETTTNKLPAPAAPDAYWTVDFGNFHAPFVEDFETWAAYNDFREDSNGRLDDADSDGTPNIVEFFHGLDPHDADDPNASLFTIEQSEEEENTLTISYLYDPRAKAAGSLHFSDGLEAGWSPDPPRGSDFFEIRFPEGLYQRTYTLSTKEAAKQFWRLSYGEAP